MKFAPELLPHGVLSSVKQLGRLQRLVGRQLELGRLQPALALRLAELPTQPGGRGVTSWQGWRVAVSKSTTIPLHVQAKLGENQQR